MFASSEYLPSYNRVLMRIVVAWAEKQNLLDENVK